MFTEDTVRGSGRTYRTLENLPDGGMFIVHSDGMRRYAQDQLVKMGRNPRAIHIAVVHNYESADRLRGRQGPLVVDHAVYEFLPLCTLALLGAILDRLRDREPAKSGVA